MGKHSENQKCDLHDTDISPWLSDPARSAERIQERGAEPGRRFPGASAGTLRVRGLPPSPPCPRRAPLPRLPLKPRRQNPATAAPPPPHHRRPCGRDRGSRRRHTAKAAPAPGGDAARATAPKSPGSRSDRTARRPPTLRSRHRSLTSPPPARQLPRCGARAGPGPGPPSPARPRPAPEALACGRREASGGSLVGPARLSELVRANEPSFDLSISYGQVWNLRSGSFGAVLITVSEVPR